MLEKPQDLISDIFRDAYRATASNLRLQQKIWQGWSRLWPGFSARVPQGTGEPFPQRWSESMLQLSKANRHLCEEQLDAAFNAWDNVWQQWTNPTSRVVPVAKQRKSMPVTRMASAATVMQPVTPPQETVEVADLRNKNIVGKVAVVTGAGGGIGAAVARELAKRGAKGVLLVDRSESVQELANSINETTGRHVAEAKVGDTTDEGFRKRVFNEAAAQFGPVTICIPAAGITRDALSVRMDKETGRADVYPIETFRQVAEVNLLAPIYWGIEMIARIAEERHARGLKKWEPEETVQGVVILLGSVSSQGNKGQIAYAVAKAGLEGAAATLSKEAIFHGVRCAIIHPGFTDTPMAQALGKEFLDKNVLPFTQLRRLIRPEEIADAICFMISNSAVSGELWADAGWHPPA